MERTCRKCGETKPIEEFEKNNTYAHGYSYRCKICKNKRQEEWRRLNPERVKKYNKGKYKKGELNHG